MKKWCLSLALILAFSMPASAQYVEARARAIRESKSLVVFVGGAQVQQVPSYAIAVSVDSLPGYPAKCIVMGVPERGDIIESKVVRHDVPLYSEYEREEVRRTPVRFTLERLKAMRGLPTADDDGEAAVSGFLPNIEAKEYAPTKYSQRLGSFSFEPGKQQTVQLWHADQDDQFGRNPNRDFPWRGPGGDRAGWTHKTALALPEGSKVKVWHEQVPIEFAPGGTLGKYRWSFPVGTILTDSLYDAGGRLREIRVRERKADEWDYYAYRAVMGKWRVVNKVHIDGHALACKSCHSHAGTSAYGIGVRGDDETVSFSPFVEGELRLRGDFPVEYVGRN